ncbi:hypothetical protein FHS42_003089 [Streptomyces zagrosensis]|uniref:Uncharacterized protein n=1 Tax=Streptomyces zagrosensis TaxID=1042984 RepID=A0A7W9Q9C3_9ACTN|nr:hypothetical protein [Streptomyces zagrosensis]
MKHLPKFHYEPFPKAPVKLAQRLIQHEQLRSGRKCTGQRYPLLLPSRQRGNGSTLRPWHADQFKKVGNGAIRFRAPRPPHPWAEGDVAAHVALREQLVVLEHQANTPTVRGYACLVTPRKPNPPAVRGL